MQRLSFETFKKGSLTMTEYTFPARNSDEQSYAVISPTFSLADDPNNPNVVIATVNAYYQPPTINYPNFTLNLIFTPGKIQRFDFLSQNWIDVSNNGNPLQTPNFPVPGQYKVVFTFRGLPKYADPMRTILIPYRAIIGGRWSAQGMIEEPPVTVS
jgi:hypothetical protein